MMSKTGTIIFVYNTATYLYRFRLGLMQTMLRRGWRVIAAAPVDDFSDKIMQKGIQFKALPLSRKGLNPFKDARLWWRLLALYRRERPDIVHHFTVKPVIFGSVAARMAAVQGIVNLVPGLGYVFLHGGWLQKIVEKMYQVAFSSRVHVIFQNQDDRDLFVRKHMVRLGQTHVICGSGVNTNLFLPRRRIRGQFNSPRVTFALITRMLWDKGIAEFVAAARICNQCNPNTRFVLAGAPDPGNPSSIPPAWLQSLRALPYMKWHGHIEDVRLFLEGISVVVLPSYREGAPRSLIEAAAMAKPVIATDVAGCREVVKAGENGLLVPVRDVDSLANAMLTMAKDPGMRCRMGADSRRKALFQLNEKVVIRKTLEVYSKLIPGFSNRKAGCDNA